MDSGSGFISFLIVILERLMHIKVNFLNLFRKNSVSIAFTNVRSKPKGDRVGYRLCKIPMISYSQTRHGFDKGSKLTTNL
jgi:hypothetical protein